MVQEATLDRMNQEVKKSKQLIDRGDDLLQVDELYEKLARAANSLAAKDNLIQVTVSSALTVAFLHYTTYVIIFRYALFFLQAVSRMFYDVTKVFATFEALNI